MVLTKSWNCTSGQKREDKANEISAKDREITYIEKAITSKEAKHKAKIYEARSGLAQQNELARYNKEMVNLCQEIDRNVGQFRVKPIGPLGRYIKLTPEAAKDDQLNSLLAVKRNSRELKGFLVDCYEDRKCLEKMMGRYYAMKQKQPMITIRKR